MSERCECSIRNGLTEWPKGSGRMIPAYKPCTNPAVRYIKIGNTAEHVCESCYQRDIAYPGSHPSTKLEYESCIGSYEDDGQ